MKFKNKYDMVVIGGGMAGYTVAIKGANQGLRVLLFEKEVLGGCCVNRGCIPMKSFLNDANKKMDFDWKSYQKQCAQILQTIQEGMTAELFHQKVTIQYKKARVLDDHIVSDGQNQYYATDIILASGSVPSLPEKYKKKRGIYTSDDLWMLDSLPRKLLIAGGGAIGLEMASAFSRVGVLTTIVEKKKEICDQYERSILQSVTRKLKQDQVRFLLGDEILEIHVPDEKNEDFQCEIVFQKSAKENYDAVLYATGRKTNISAIKDMKNMPKIIHGKIWTNPYGQTSIPNLYCIGDANGQNMNAQYASWQAEMAVMHICKKREGEKLADDKCSFSLPECIYTEPPVAKIGKSKKELLSMGEEFREGSVSYRNLAMGRILGYSSGKIKVFRDIHTDLLLGAQIVGKESYELIHILQPYMLHGIPCRQMRNQIFAHPSLAEGLKSAIENTYEEQGAL